MRFPYLRFALIPMVVAALSVALAVTTRLEQERQYDALRSLYESHARSAGHLVREAAQEATWSTGLVYSMSAEGAALLLDLLGSPDAGEDCAAVQTRVPDMVIWARPPSAGELVTDSFDGGGSVAKLAVTIALPLSLTIVVGAVTLVK